MRKKKEIQFRYYQMDRDACLFALQGEDWVREYGKDIDYLHFHNYLEIGHCIYGEGHMVMGEDILEYQGGEFTVIPKNFPHTTNSIPGSKSQWEYLFIDEDSFLHKVFPLEGKEKRRQKLAESVNSRIHFFREEEYPKLAGYIKALFSVMESKEEFFMEEALGLLRAMLVNLARINEKKEDLPSLGGRDVRMETTPKILTVAIDYIGENFKENLSIEVLAKYCHISQTHLRRLFSSYLRMGVLDYIHLVRIQAACKLLKKTDASIEDIAYKCGYSNVSTFNRNFKKIRGKSPNIWRKNRENFEHQISKYKIHSQRGW